MDIINAKIFLENSVIENGYLITEGELIKSYGEMSAYIQVNSYVVDAKGLNLIPGFIDQHVHGGYGLDFMDQNVDLNEMLKRFPEEGTTSLIATTLTQSFDRLCNVVENITSVIDNQDKLNKQTIIEGIHLEGPYINAIHKGAQNEAYIIKPNIEEMQTYINKSNNNVLKISYACELADKSFQDFLVANNINQSVVHSDATYQQVKDSMVYGVNALSHFHNGSSGHHHRTPGVVSAGLGLPLKVELIVDGIHLHPNVVEMVTNIKGYDDIILITDSMRAKNLPDGQYDLGGLNVNKVGFEARLENGALAGSVAAMDQCARNYLTYTDAKIKDLVKVTSTNAAKLHNLYDRIGSIRVGKLANIVLCNDNVDINFTIIKGEVAFQK